MTTRHRAEIQPGYELWWRQNHLPGPPPPRGTCWHVLPADQRPVGPPPAGDDFTLVQQEYDRRYFGTAVVNPGREATVLQARELPLTSALLLCIPFAGPAVAAGRARNEA